MTNRAIPYYTAELIPGLEDIPLLGKRSVPIGSSAVFGMKGATAAQFGLTTLGRWAVTGYGAMELAGASLSAGEVLVLVGVNSAIAAGLTTAAWEVGVVAGSAVEASLQHISIASFPLPYYPH